MCFVICINFQMNNGSLGTAASQVIVNNSIIAGASPQVIQQQPAQTQVVRILPPLFLACVPDNIFFYFSMKKYVVDTHYKCLGELLLMDTAPYVFMEKYEKYLN